ncbi:MAG: sugar phosphate nucleotidyltransferase [Candidatus Zixiibacteriota bacterium]
MKVIIPAAGVGTRLKPHTLTLPKPLLHIGGKTILDYLLEPVTELDPEEVRFVIGYKGDMIKEHVEKNYSFNSTFVVQDELLGLGYALHIALRDVANTPLMVLLGDTIIESDLKKFIRAGKYALGLRQVPDPQRFGIAELDDGYVSHLIEKPKEPKSNLALIGLYYFEESDSLKLELQKLVESGKTTRGEIQLTDALARMIANGTKFTPFEVEGWFDCGKKETMLSTNRHFLKKVPVPERIQDSVIIPPVYVGDDVSIEKSVIGPNVSLARGAVIKHSIISDSIIGRDARVEDMVIQESIVGREVVLKGRKKILNIGDSTEISGC